MGSENLEITILYQRLVQPNSKYVASLGLDILKSVDSDKNRTKESF